MKYLIAGLGNIGHEYDQTRHNIGFEVLDQLAIKENVTFKLETQAYKTEFKFKSKTFVLIKPTTYMNLSGKSIRYWLTTLKIEPSNLLVVLDDLNLPFGKQRLKGNGSDGGHNGLKSIDQLLGNNNYARLRIGIGDEFAKGRQIDYVLGKWNEEELNQLDEIKNYSCEVIKSFATIGIQFTMNQFNKK